MNEPTSSANPVTGASPPVGLTIAGSDSSGGAGIQADLKTFHAHQVYGVCAITSVTAQNTRGVDDAFELPPHIVRAQADALADDFTLAAAKTGMLSSAALIEAVVAFLRQRFNGPLVVDPVMVSTSGHRLLREDAIEALCQTLLPLATVVTPNLHEAQILADMAIGPTDSSAILEAGRRIRELGASAVLIKGGHGDGSEAIDYLISDHPVEVFRAPRINTTSTHGTGCTYSAAICANLARGHELSTAIERAKSYVTEAIRRGPALGGGHGPTEHFHSFQSPESP